MVLKEVKVPTLVQNGTLTHVILDCVYDLNHSEKDGMILKWYFNGKTIFQWIPPSKPKVMYVQNKRCLNNFGPEWIQNDFFR